MLNIFKGNMLNINNFNTHILKIVKNKKNLSTLFSRKEIPKVYVRQVKYHPPNIAPNTEMYVDYGECDNLLFVSGESWTWGENIIGPDIICSPKMQDNIDIRIKHCFWGTIAHTLNTNILISSYPGNSNENMLCNFDRLVTEFSEDFKKFKKIFVLYQLTSPGRDYNIILKDYNLPNFDVLYSKEKTVDNLYELEDFFRMYEHMIISGVSKIQDRIPNMKLFMWKNFNNFIGTQKKYNKFFPNIHICDTPWTQFSALILGRNFELPYCNEVGWFDKTYRTYKNFRYDRQEIIEEFKRLEKFNEHLKSSPLHGYHPNAECHFLWANFLINYWKLLKE